METTRHFVSTVFLVNENRIALHDHKKLEIDLPPGGHIDRDELPHQSAKREVYEETGLDVKIDGEDKTFDTDNWSREIPSPQYLLLDDVVMNEVGDPAHQHINFVYFAESESDEIDPAGESEVSTDKWYWISKSELRSGEKSSIDSLTRAIAIEAIEYYD